MSTIVLILMVVVTATLVTVPLLPSILAWRRGLDSDALPIRERYDEEAHRTAAVVRDRVRRDELDDVERVEGDVLLAEGETLDRPISVTGSFEASPGTTVEGVHADLDLVLRPDVQAAGWLHAGRRADLGPEATVTGSLSAEDSIDVALHARFERLAAPVIRFGREARPVGEEAAYLVQEPTPVPEDVRWIAWSKAIYDDFEIQNGTWMNGDLIVRGDLRVGEGAVIDGTVKVHGSVEVADGVRITGSLFSDGNVRIGPKCRIDGLCTAGGTLRIESDTVVGQADRRITVSAERIEVCDGVRIHGVVVATEHGTVVAEPAPTATEPVQGN